MTPAEVAFFWATMLVLLAASLLYIFAVSFRRSGYLGAINGLAAAAFVLLSVTITVRWIATGHPPVMRAYENSLAGAWTILLFYLVAGWLWPGLRAAGLAMAPVTLVTLGYGYVSTPIMEAFEPPFQSGWLIIHVIFAWWAYSAFTLAAGVGAVYLLKERSDRLGRENPFFARVPALPVLDDLNYGIITFGFLNQMIMLIAGAIWAKNLWGAFWGWDPIETWTLITWLAYGLYLHLRSSWNWQGRRMAWFAVLSLATVIISFWGIAYITSLHPFLHGG